MSTSPDSPRLNSNSKFTRGEKCIFAHLVVTFMAIITIVIVYFVHLYLVRHVGNDYKLTRRSNNANTDDKEDLGGCVGAVQVRGVAVCGAVLVGARWSLAPAHCVVARSRPDLAPLLPFWQLRYAAGESDVRRGVAHPEFEEDELANDVGLFEHLLAIDLLPCPLPDEIVMEDELLEVDTKDIIMVIWQKNREGSAKSVARPLSSVDCSRLVDAVVDRPHPAETCFAPTVLQDSGELLLGAALFVRAHMVGVSSWGDTGAGASAGFPLVVLQLAPYKHWLETTMTL